MGEYIGYPSNIQGSWPIPSKMAVSDILLDIEVKKNDIAMAQNIGGSGATVITTILKRMTH